MHKLSIKKSILLLSLFSAQHVFAEDGPIQLTASAQGIWDSNFSRSPLNDDERTLLSSAGFSFDDTFGRQRLIAKWYAHHYQYDVHPDFDATTDTGQLSWKGLLGNQFNTDVDFFRNSYQVDRLEFFGKDIVTRDDLTARLGYGNDNRLSFHAGGRKSTQEHSNSERNSLDFEEKEGFADVGYQTSNKSTFFLRYKSGNRSYTNTPLDTSGAGLEVIDLDFDYQQVELDSQWVLSPKTSVSALVAGYKRDGSINDATGSLASIAVEWKATEKINLAGGYALSEPAIGETSDSPSRVKTVSLSAHWQYSAKWSVGSSAAYSVIDYDKLAPELIRKEKLYNFSPLTIAFDSGRHWKVRVDSGWRKNESALYSRNYVSRQINAGLFFYY